MVWEIEIGINGQLVSFLVRPVAWVICFIYPCDRVFGLVVEHPPLTRKARVRFPGRVIPKTLKMEPTAVVRDVPHKQ